MILRRTFRMLLRGWVPLLLAAMFGLGCALRPTGLVADDAVANDAITVERDVAVPMSDGTVLRANVFRPAAEGPFPVLVMRTPYGKPGQVDESLVRAGFIIVVQDARGRFASDGQFESFVRAETHDGSDGLDTVAWAAKLPNSSGKVGLFGTSYPGFLAWRAAGRKPPALGAMAAFSIPASFFDLEGPGAFRPGRRLKWWYESIAPDLRRRAGGPPPHSGTEAAALWNAGEADRLLHVLPWRDLPDDLFGGEAPIVRAWLAEPWQDPWRLDLDAAGTIVPNLNVCGWYDHCNGSIDLHQAIATKGGSFAAKRYSRLIVGPWSHAGLGRRKQGEIDFGPVAELDLGRLYADWFGHWLRGDKNNVERWAPVRVFVMGVGEWRNFYEWPPKYSSPREWFLDSDGAANTPAGNGRLLADAPSGDAANQTDPNQQGYDQYAYDPHNPVPTLWTPAFFTVPADQRPLAARTDILAYQTEPLADFVEAIGYPEAVLFASSSCPDTDFFARLIDVGPDGSAVDVTSGMVRARYRDRPRPNQPPAAGEPPAAAAPGTASAQGAAAEWSPTWLSPDKVVEFHIRLRPTAHRFLAGHRIRLDVTSSDFPNYDRNHNTAADQNADAELVTARQTIHHGPAFRSRLVLPVMRVKKELPIWAEGAATLPPPKFVKEFGTPGDQPGEFHSPIGIAIDALDRIYVTEFHNHRVQVFDTDGHSLRTIPLSSQPGGIAVDAQGRIYVALMLEHKVQVFDAEGKQVLEWGKAGGGDGEFNQPGGIAIAADGSVVVVDQANHRLQRFTPAGGLIAQWGTHGSQAGQFGGAGAKGSRLSGPHFCAFDRDGRLYTTEAADGRIQCFDAGGKPLHAWADNSDGPGGFGGRPNDRTNPFQGPIGVVVDHQGRIWVSATNNRVQCFSAEGKFLTGIGDEGSEPGEFIIPHGLAIDSRGLLYVVDASNHRVQVFELP